MNCVQHKECFLASHATSQWENMREDGTKAVKNKVFSAFMWPQKTIKATLRLARLQHITHAACSVNARWETTWKTGKKKSSQRFFLRSNLRPSGLVVNQVKSQTRDITAVCHVVEPLDTSHAMNQMQMKKICRIEMKMFGTEENGKYLQPIMSIYLYFLLYSCGCRCRCVGANNFHKIHIYLLLFTLGSWVLTR